MIDTTRRGFLTGALATALLTTVPGMEQAVALADDMAMEGVYRGVPWHLIWHPHGSAGTIDPLNEVAMLGWKARVRPGQTYGDFVTIIEPICDEPEPQIVKAVKDQMFGSIDGLLARAA